MVFQSTQRAAQHVVFYGASKEIPFTALLSPGKGENLRTQTKLHVHIRY